MAQRSDSRLSAVMTAGPLPGAVTGRHLVSRLILCACLLEAMCRLVDIRMPVIANHLDLPPGTHFKPVGVLSTEEPVLPSITGVRQELDDFVGFSPSKVKPQWVQQPGMSLFGMELDLKATVAGMITARKAGEPTWNFGAWRYFAKYSEDYNPLSGVLYGFLLVLITLFSAFAYHGDWIAEIQAISSTDSPFGHWRVGGIAVLSFSLLAFTTFLVHVPLALMLRRIVDGH